jgi:hypothetical protein
MWRIVRWLLMGIGSMLVLGFCFASGFLLGAIRAELDAYHRRYFEEREALAPILASDPAFAGVEIHKKSDGR